jgi:hypothetical protein
MSVNMQSNSYTQCCPFDNGTFGIKTSCSRGETLAVERHERSGFARSADVKLHRKLLAICGRDHRCAYCKVIYFLCLLFVCCRCCKRLYCCICGVTIMKSYFKAEPVIEVLVLETVECALS